MFRQTAILEEKWFVLTLQTQRKVIIILFLFSNGVSKKESMAVWIEG